jgi:hypothetical protein
VEIGKKLADLGYFQAKMAFFAKASEKYWGFIYCFM